MSYFLAGDGPFFFAEQLGQISWQPTLWFPETGLGDNALSRLWLDYPFRLFVKVLSMAGLSWWLIEKILWGTVLAIAIYGAWAFSKHFITSKKWKLLACLIYVTNTYALLLFGGGQLGVAIAYAFFPIVLRGYFSGDPTKSILKRGLMFGLLMVFDLRIAYLAVLAGVLFFVLRRVYAVRENRPGRIIRDAVREFFLPICVSLTLHLYWILPVLSGGLGPGGLSREITSPGMLRFLSVADFSHTLSLLHPNWPENLFGKVYFLQPEFLILPFMAFGTFLFLKHKKSDRDFDYAGILSVGFMALAGLFLAKGVREPMGFLYDWGFSHIPGFVMFRDPTKFYIFTALGYSVLIPHFLESLHTRISSIRKIHLPGHVSSRILFTLFLLFWIFSIRELPEGKLTGNFRPENIPAEYTMLKDTLIADSEPSRVLWLPSPDKFAYSSPIHPVLSAKDHIRPESDGGYVSYVKTPEFRNHLRVSGVKYIVIPVDLEHKIFMDGYRYAPDIRSRLIQALESGSFERMGTYRNLAVFTNTDFAFVSDTPDKLAYSRQLALYGAIISGSLWGLYSFVYIIHSKRRYKSATRI